MEHTKEQKRAFKRLKAASKYYVCGRYLASIEEVKRQEIYSHYEFERLQRKYDDIIECYRNVAGSDWNQTFFSYFFQYLGDPKNKAAYKLLARRVGYNAILRERASQNRLEALLLGASGLLKDYGCDHYTEELRREASYLMRKHNITPLSSSDWNLNKIHPKNHPVLRLAQAAALFFHYELLFNKIIECTCLTDIEDIFKVEASEYWTTHYVPSHVSSSEVKRLGGDKCNILGINVVVMIQYAYGSYISNDEILDRAQNLIQDLKPEINYIVNRWRNYGIRPKTAFEGQALLQLGNEYCAKGRCEECYVGHRAIKDMSWLDDDDDQ